GPWLGWIGNYGPNVYVLESVSREPSTTDEAKFLKRKSRDEFIVRVEWKGSLWKTCWAVLIAFALCVPASASEFRSLISTSIALASLKEPAPKPVKPDRKDCPECKGTGRVRTGDGISWTECDACVAPVEIEPTPDPEFTAGAAACNCTVTGDCACD